MKAAGRTDTGLVRAHNEDAIAFDDKAGVLVVADGVGGHAGGETAAVMAVSVFREAFRFRSAYDKRDSREEKEFLEHLVDKANFAIHRITSRPGLKEMGTTLVALSAARNSVVVAHVGDSRAYLYRRGKLKRLTRDHSVVESKKIFGLFPRSEEAQRRDPLRNVVLRALGPDPRVHSEVTVHGRKRGDLFLLCTDGLTDYVSEKDIQWAIEERGDDLDAAALAMIDLANRNGGHDNITVGLMQF
ncbi:MAG: PP2C family protein-serine/threonine phosphatase [Planctomycetota bacterium]